MVAQAKHRRFGEAPKAVPAGDSCKVLGWPVFKPGFWKGDYYSSADCRRIVENFQRLSAGESPYLKAKAKLGHDDEQRLANSLGLPNQGQIVACRLIDGDQVEIDIHGVPVATGQEMEAGRINDGSVELEWDVPDPDDPSKTVPGPVLTAVAFLGEEQPGVKGLPPPRATFSETNRRRTRRIRFSEVDPMNRDELIAQLKSKGIDVGANPALANLPDDALAAMLQALPAAAPAAGPAAAMTNGGDADDLKQKYADLEKQNKDLMGRFGALEKAFAEVSKDKDEVKQAAAFARDFQSARHEQKIARATEVVAKAIMDGQLIPAAKDVTITDLAKLSDDRKDCFAEGAGKGKTPFAAACDELLTRPKDKRFSANANPLAAGPGIDPNRRAKLLSATESGRNILRKEAEAAAAK